MAGLRIILGGVLQTELRALVLVRAKAGDLPPRILLTDVATSTPAPFTLEQLPAPGATLRGVLDRREVRAYRVAATGLRAASRYRLTAAAGALSQFAEATTLPAALPQLGLTAAVASCYYDGYRRDAQLLAALQQTRAGQKPAFHIWTGDNLYLDVPPDSPAHRPYGHSVDRYLRYFLDSGYGRVRALAPAFTAYDDHEFWNNYPEFVLWLSRTWGDDWKDYRAAAIECAALFQSGLNPGGPGFFSFAIDPLAFFFLDTRTFRERHESGRSLMATRPAMAAFEHWVKQLNGPGVLVLGQPLWIDEGGFVDYGPPSFRDQYAAIWACLRRAPYDMLVISGDVHHSRVLRISFRGAQRHVFEFVSSPACHIPEPLSSAQGRGKLKDVPSAVEHSGQALTARAFFGTDAPHTFGLLRFTPLANREVRIGATFIDYVPKDRAATARPIPTVPRVEGLAQPAFCHELNLCTLRMR
jgi:hypothetical protein